MSPARYKSTLSTIRVSASAPTVRNQGSDRSAATTLRYYRSSGATISTADTEVGTDDVSEPVPKRMAATSAFHHHAADDRVALGH